MPAFPYYDTKAIDALNAQAVSLLGLFASRGYGREEPAVLQPAEIFLDRSGEEIRRRTFTLMDPSGRELCLRPDLTIPVARDYLASAQAGQPAGFCYLGPVFRYRGGRSSEFLQAGIESFGRQDRAAADAEMLTLGLEATAAFGITDVEVHTGDVALFIALIDALNLYPVWRRRLIKDFNRKISLDKDLEQLTVATGAGRNEYEGVLAALAGSDRKAALALVTDLMSIAGTTNVGGRTVAEIADRFLEQSTLKGGALPRNALDLIKRSAGTASAKLQFCRLAFGAAGSAGAQIDLGDAETISRGFFEDDKTKLAWNLPRVLLPKTRVKLLLNLLLIAGQTIPRGGRLTVDPIGAGESMGFKVSAAGVNAKVPPAVAALVGGETGDTPLDAHRIQPFYASLLAEASGVKVSMIMEGDVVAVSAQ